MDEKRFENITGREALRRLALGEVIYGGSEFFGITFNLDEDGTLIYKDKAGRVASMIDMFVFVKSKCLYIKKPFDVRKTMFDRPNEWVAAYNDERGKWIQVGFDAVNMRPTKAYYGYTGEVKGANGDLLTGYELETCIPIEDVPEDTGI